MTSREMVTPSVSGNAANPPRGARPVDPAGSAGRIPFSAQISAIETAKRIVLGGTKAPRPSSSEARFLADQLSAAATSIRNIGATR